MKPIPTYGDHITMKDWLDCVKSGGFIDYDGHGCYATEKEMSNKTVVPSDVIRKKMDKNPKWTHVVWFNK